MAKHTVTVDFHGIPLIVTGRYRPAEQDIGLGAAFEIESVKARAILVRSIEDVELDCSKWTGVWEYLESEAIEQIEAGFEAAACEAADARREARRDAERE